MKRKLLLLCALCAVLSVMAQKDVDARIAEIRKAYADRLTIMSYKPYDDVEMEKLTVSYNRNYPGTGLYRHTDTYYWTDDENEEYMLKPALYFVTSQYSMCFGRYRYSREYLLDIATGEPMFMLLTTQLDDEAATRREFRFYFQDGKVIKQVPERIGPFEDDSVLAPDIELDANGKAVNLNSAFDHVKSVFSTLVPTYAWE